MSQRSIFCGRLVQNSVHSRDYPNQTFSSYFRCESNLFRIFGSSFKCLMFLGPVKLGVIEDAPEQETRVQYLEYDGKSDFAEYVHRIISSEPRMIIQKFIGEGQSTEM